MKKRVGAVEQFEFQALSESNQLHIAIVVSGWVLDEYTGRLSYEKMGGGGGGG